MAGKKGMKWAHRPDKKKQVQTFIDGETYDNLEKQSKYKKISKSRFIRELLMEFFK